MCFLGPIVIRPYLKVTYTLLSQFEEERYQLKITVEVILSLSTTKENVFNIATVNFLTARFLSKKDHK